MKRAKYEKFVPIIFNMYILHKLRNTILILENKENKRNIVMTICKLFLQWDAINKKIYYLSAMSYLAPIFRDSTENTIAS